jgi:uncharacterized protein (TIGR03435 family)
MPDFALGLSYRAVDRAIVDQTGLEGTYDFELYTTLPRAPDAPEIFSALEQQLGLKLVSQRGPVEFLTIKHIEKPSPN